MGYEIKIYAGLRDKRDDKHGDYFQVVAMVDLCKTGASAIERLALSTDGHPVYFYGEDGENECTEDRYGKRLTSLPLADVLDALRKSANANPNYRRYKPALALLENLQDFQGDEVECLLFGH